MAEIDVTKVDRENKKVVMQIGNRTRTYFEDRFGRILWNETTFSRNLPDLPGHLKGKAFAQAKAILQPKKSKKPA